MESDYSSSSFSERKGSGELQHFVYDKNARFIQQNEYDHGKLHFSLLRWLKEVFLPIGYPSSVSSDYIHYQFWDSLQAFFSSISSSLSLKETLSALGVGESSASPLAATLTWLVKDGSGMISSITFAYWQGGQLDCNIKQWRLFADVANDLCHLLKLMSPLLPFPTMVTLCLSSILLSGVGVAGVATRAALTVHQAKKGNMADVSAKDGSQETMVNLVSLLMSIIFLPFFTRNLLMTWAVFIICVIMHLYANYKAMKAIRMKILNQPRFLYILERFVTHSYTAGITEGNLQEPLLFGPAFEQGFLPGGFHVSLGCSFNEALLHCHWSDLSQKKIQDYLGLLRKNNFVIVFSEDSKFLHIVIHEETSSEDQLVAYFCAYLFTLNYMHIKKGIPLSAEFLITRGVPGDYTIMLSEAANLAKRQFLLLALESKGWELHQNRLGFGEWRLA